jgi:pimeloyl-ACP methyl ester carboxylesterase
METRHGAGQPSFAFGHGGVRLAYDLWGDPAGPPVLLLHGGGQTRHAWRGTAASLSARGCYTMVADLRGHGDSDWPADADYTLESFAADVVALAAELPSAPTIVGASMGGLAALLAQGELDPPPAAALVLVDIATRMDPGAVMRIVSFMTAYPDGFGSLDEAADVVAAYQPHRERPRDLSGLQKNLRQGEDGRWRWHWDPAFMTSDRRPAATADGDRLNRAATRLEVPTLLVRGRLSDMVSEEAVAEFLTHVPHAETADVSGAAHMVAGDRNDAFTSVVAGFVLRHSQP